MKKPVFDVCVVGSGPGGGIATYVLANAGLKVALVEAGPVLRAGIDYGTHAWPYEVREQRIRAGQSPIPNLFADHREKNHFTPIGDRPDHGWLKALGGRSLCWAGHSLRFGPLDFKQWPISYDEVAPHYSQAERFMGVYGYKDGLYNLPDGEFLKPVPMRCPEMLLKRGVERLKARGHTMEFVAQRKAMLTEDHWSNRARFHFCGQCEGCCVDAKYTSVNTPIPLAMKTGNLTLFMEAMLTRILMDESTQRVSGIEYTTAKGAVERVKAKTLVLACSAVETARQLLLNRTREFPTGLANRSGNVGRNLTSHFGVTVVGYFPELRRRDASNDDGTHYYHSLLTGLYWGKPNPNFEGTYQVQCGSGVQPWRLAGRVVDGFGSAVKRQIKEKSIGHAGMNMQGTTLISPRKFVDLDSERKDRYGLSLSRVHLHYEPSDVAMAQDMVETCEEIIRAGGGEILSSPGKVTVDELQIDFNHWVGTVRMGTRFEDIGRQHIQPMPRYTEFVYRRCIRLPGKPGEESDAHQYCAVLENERSLDREISTRRAGLRCLLGGVPLSEAELIGLATDFGGFGPSQLLRAFGFASNPFHPDGSKRNHPRPGKGQNLERDTFSVFTTRRIASSRLGSAFLVSV